ncbi:MAG: hypothetical protein IMZ61_06185, partial [Planctomycetes bacterium]|nr:hypothetical protein [Planctomycetota bacterium]
MYINQVVVPITPPLFIATPTVTRAPESFVTDAQKLEEQGRISQAIQAYRDAVQADPKNASNYIALARLQIYSNDYQNGLTNIENALLLNPNNSIALALRGWVKGFLGDWLDAESSLKEAIRLDQNNAVAYAYYAE